MAKRRVLTFSGGIDTATLLYFSLRDGYEVIPAILNIGHRKYKYESDASKTILKLLKFYYPKQILTDLLELRYIPSIWEQLKVPYDNSRTAMGTGETYYMNDEEAFKKTYIPLRNVVTTVIMAIVAEVFNANEVAFGFCKDQEFYPDTYEFTLKISPVIESITVNKIKILSPLGNRYRVDYMKEVYDDGFGFIYKHTFSCIGDIDINKHCGYCEHCIDRRLIYVVLERKYGIKDEIEYVDKEKIYKIVKYVLDKGNKSEWWSKDEFRPYIEDWLKNKT